MATFGIEAAPRLYNSAQTLADDCFTEAAAGAPPIEKDMIAPESHAEPTMPVATKTRGGPERGISAMIFKQCDIQQIENGVVFDEADEDMSCKRKRGMKRV